MSLSQKINEGRKAVAALVVPALVMLGTALREGSDRGTAVSAAEWVEVAIAALATSGVVYAVRNGVSRDASTSTPQV